MANVVVEGAELFAAVILERSLRVALGATLPPTEGQLWPRGNP